MESGSRRGRGDDTRSNVDSFYGTRRSAYNALPVHNDDDEDHHEPATAQRNRRDSASTFFGRNADDFLQPQHQPVLRKDDQVLDDPFNPHDLDSKSWDVYADFNNTGPRYSGVKDLDPGPRHSTSKGGFSDNASTSGGDAVELVTVPAFGAEWSKAELKSMTKAGRSEEKNQARTDKWREWNHDRKGLFGKKWLTRKVIVWVMFGLVILVIILVAICIPRVPSFGYNPNAPLNQVKGAPDPYFSPNPVNFTFTANLDLEISTSGNIIPLHMNNIHAKLYIVNTNKLVAEGDTGGFNAGHGGTQSLDIPVHFSYTATNSTDETYNLVHNACKNKSLSTTDRPGLNVFVLLEMHIRGLIGKRTTSTDLTNIPCPIELSMQSA